MNYTLLQAARDMRARLHTTPTNYVHPRMCVGDFDTWDSAIKRAESGDSLQFVAQDGYHTSTGWCVIGPTGGIVLKCEKEIQARNTAESLNQLIDERAKAELVNALTPAIQAINGAIMLLVELQHGFVKGAGHWNAQINARVESLKARKEKLQSLMPAQP